MKQDSIARLEGVTFRLAGSADAQAVAKLHAESWRRHYRGAYSDAFLDGDVLADRLATWGERLREPDPSRCTILAEDGDLVGFANTFFDADPTWGALLDNLHVAAGHKRRGVGSRLLALTAAALSRRANTSGLYVWVLEQNLDARSFYEAHDARRAGREQAAPPGAIASRLNGSPAKLRYAWPQASVLLAASAAKAASSSPVHAEAPSHSRRRAAPGPTP
jgi:GNAT superfamily N-acetyltransferase